MTVQLEFACVYEAHKDPNRFALKHISERMNKDETLLCPLCRVEVIPRKGSIRQHHFSHTTGADCSASEETILHFNAKQYIKKCINERLEVTISVPPELISPGLQTILKLLGISNYPLSLIELGEFYRFKKASVEKQVLDKVADIFVSRGYNSTSGFVKENTDPQRVEIPFIIEVKVTHGIGDAKTKSFTDADIPFLEVIPEQTEKGYSFTASSLNIPYFMKMRFELIKGFLAKEYESELMVMAENVFTAQKKEEIRQEVRAELIEEVRAELNLEKDEKLIREVRSQVIDTLIEDVNFINFREHISAEQFKKMNTIEVKAYRSEVRRTQLLEEIKYKTTGTDGKKFVSINNRYSFYAAENILFDTIKTLHQEYKVELLLGGYADSQKERVIGFRFLLPDKYLYAEQLKSILRDSLLGIKEIDFEEE